MIKSHVIIPSKKKKKKITCNYPLICVSVCTFVFFAKLLFHFTCNYPLICVYVCNYPSKQFQSMPTEFEVKVSQGTQTASYDSNQKPLPPIQPCAFFLFLESSTSTDSPQTSYTHTSYPLPPSPSNSHGVC